MDQTDRYIPRVGDIVSSPWLVGEWRVINAPPPDLKHTKTTIENSQGTIVILILWKDIEKVGQW